MRASSPIRCIISHRLQSADYGRSRPHPGTGKFDPLPTIVYLNGDGGPCPRCSHYGDRHPRGLGRVRVGCPESAIVSAQICAKPPSTKSSAPLTKLLSSEQRGRPPRVPRGSAFHAAIAASVQRHGQAAALAQGAVIGGSIRHSVPLLRDGMTAILVRFEWHDDCPRVKNR